MLIILALILCGINIYFFTKNNIILHYKMLASNENGFNSLGSITYLRISYRKVLRYKKTAHGLHEILIFQLIFSVDFLLHVSSIKYLTFLVNTYIRPCIFTTNRPRGVCCGMGWAVYVSGGYVD